jgi:hypothetical protein
VSIANQITRLQRTQIMTEMKINPMEAISFPITDRQHTHYTTPDPLSHVYFGTN